MWAEQSQPVPGGFRGKLLERDLLYPRGRGRARAAGPGPATDGAAGRRRAARRSGEQHLSPTSLGMPVIEAFEFKAFKLFRDRHRRLPAAVPAVRTGPSAFGHHEPRRVTDDHSERAAAAASASRMRPS